MSFDSSGLPETVCAPETTQLFEPSTSGRSSKNMLRRGSAGLSGQWRQAR